MTEFIDTIYVVLVWNNTSFTWNTVSADVHGRANLAVVETSASINRASLISNLVVGHPFKSVVCFTTMTSEIFVLAGNYDLRRDLNIWPCSFSSNFNSIRDCWSSSV